MQLMVLRRHPKEFNPGPVGCDPRHFRQINANRRSSVIRVHQERQVLPAPQACRQAQPAPSRRNIRDFSTGKAEFVHNDRPESHHLSSVPAGVYLVKLALLF
jgi:hypothetical protein